MRCFDLTSENEPFLTSARALREFCSGYPVKPLKFCKIDFLNVVVFPSRLIISSSACDKLLS